MTWRKLIASFVAASGALFATAIYFAPSVSPFSHDWIAQTGIAALGVAAVFAAPFIWRGRYWSLWLLRIACIASSACTIALAASDFASVDSAAEYVVGNIAFYAWLVSFPTFFILFLWHPQVVSEFRPTELHPG